jgi:hypothetical protein
MEDVFSKTFGGKFKILNSISATWASGHGRCSSFVAACPPATPATSPEQSGKTSISCPMCIIFLVVCNFLNAFS